MLKAMVQATSVDEALEEVEAIISLGHSLWAYAYMRHLYAKSPELYYGALIKKPATLLPIVYTPTVGEACQKFGRMPMQRRGCYISIKDKGNIRAVLEDYAAAEMSRSSDGHYVVDCIVFSDGGRILGLGDLGAWGMGIPIGKLDLYTVCAGVNPYRTIPVIIDAGIAGSEGNTNHVEVRDSGMYTGLREERKKHKSTANTMVNTCYYGEESIIKEFMEAATALFGREVLLQFEDFNSNDAFPLLAEYREKFLTYNDDIQGTAAITVAALMGAAKLKAPDHTDFSEALRHEKFLFHGAGSANLGTLELLAHEAGVPKSQLMVTNSRGIIWMSEDGSEGSFRNNEQKEFARVGRPDYDTKDLVAVIEHEKPTCLIGAVGVAPGCFDQRVVQAMVRANNGQRPIIFALSNPMSAAEITAQDCYTWSNGAAIFGSGTRFDPLRYNGKFYNPAQVNNVYIFPGVSFGAISCKARHVPDSFFMVAAEAVAHSLDDECMDEDRILPHPDKLREVGLNVATAVVMEAQRLKLATQPLGESEAAVKAHLDKTMWSPSVTEL